MLKALNFMHSVGKTTRDVYNKSSAGMRKLAQLGLGALDKTVFAGEDLFFHNNKDDDSENKAIMRKIEANAKKTARGG